MATRSSQSEPSSQLGIAEDDLYLYQVGLKLDLSDSEAPKSGHQRANQVCLGS